MKKAKKKQKTTDTEQPGQILLRPLAEKLKDWVVRDLKFLRVKSGGVGIDPYGEEYGYYTVNFSTSNCDYGIDVHSDSLDMRCDSVDVRTDTTLVCFAYAKDGKIYEIGGEPDVFSESAWWVLLAGITKLEIKLERKKAKAKVVTLQKHWSYGLVPKVQLHQSR